MGGSPKRGGSNGGGVLMSRGRVILVTVLVLQLVLVVCFMKAPSLIWSSPGEEIGASAALDEAAPPVSSGSWLWRMFRISTTSPNCVDANGRVVTEVVKGSAIKCSDRSSLLRIKWIEPKRKPKRETKRGVTSSLVPAKGPALHKVNATTVFRNSHGANAGLREGRSRLRRGGVIGDARNSSSVVGDVRQERVQMGRDLPATGDTAMATDFEAARGTKGASWRMRKEFAANIRSSLERDSIRFRARTVGYGDLRQRNREGYLRGREGKNGSGVIARVHASNVSATIAPGARITPNVSDSVAPVARVGANVSDSVAPVARIRPSTLVLDDEQLDVEEPEVDELAEADPEVAVPRSEVSSEARRGPLPSFSAGRSNTSLEISTRSNTSLEISPTSTSLEISGRNTSLAEISSGNSSFSSGNSSLTEISPRNTSLVGISSGNSSLADISSGNSSLADISSGNSSSADISSGNSSSADISSGKSSLAEISSGNSSLAEISSGNSSLAKISSGNSSLVEISSGNTSLGISMRNSSLEISSRNTSLDQPSESLARNSTSLVEFEQVASLLSAPSAAQNATLRNATAAINNATCPQGLLYVYRLPKKFNTELLENCSQLLSWGDRCEELSNSGLGTHLKSSPLQNQQNASSGPWYATDQFNGEVIFHKRILAHPCRTRNPELAKAFFIPYYGGLDVARFLFNVTNKKFTSLDRDRLGKELVAWLSRSPYWKRRQGSDHFLFLGRITWDFRRKGSHGWGSGFINMAEMANVTKLALERNPWDDSETAIPYPTSFHPRNDSEVVEWQNEVRGRKRDLLFSFAGGKRTKFSNDFRVTLFEQCEKAESCAVLDCSGGKCLEDALATTKLFMRSTFCLQPRGDSFTRRSIFDTLVAGCIPVFFWSKSAYLQYHWHFPSDHRSYSVFIPKQDIVEGVQIQDVLSKLPPAQVRQMQETVIEMIPRLVYAQGLVKFRDAFDTTIDQVMANFQLRLHQNASNGITEAVAAPVVDSKPVGAVRA